MTFTFIHSFIHCETMLFVEYQEASESFSYSNFNRTFLSSPIEPDFMHHVGKFSYVKDGLYNMFCLQLTPMWQKGKRERDVNMTF